MAEIIYASSFRLPSFLGVKTVRAVLLTSSVHPTSLVSARLGIGPASWVARHGELLPYHRALAFFPDLDAILHLGNLQYSP